MSSPYISSMDGSVRTVAVLAGVPLFAELGPSILSELAARCVQRRLDGGAYLFRAGELADRLFVLADGTLEVVGDSGVLNTIAPAALVGELAVLRGAPRSAGVRARGPVIVLAIEAREFLELARRRPELALAVAREVANGFVGAERRALDQRTPVWAVVLDGAMEPDYALDLARAALSCRQGLGTGRRISVFAPVSSSVTEEGGYRIEVQSLLFGSAHEVAAMVASARRESALVVVAAMPDALAQVLNDCTGAVVEGATIEVTERVRVVEIVATGAPSATRVVGPPRVSAADSAARVARLLMRRSIGLALGGGGARALTQLGVLEVLAERGLPIDFIAGTSMGATVGGLVLSAGLQRATKIVRELDGPLKVARRFLEPRATDSGRIEGRRLASAFASGLPVANVEDLPIPFAGVALDVDSGEQQVLRAGRLSDVLRACGLMPGMLQSWTFQPPGAPAPIRYGDGGLVDLVPVDVVRAMGADLVVGVPVVHVRDFEAMVDTLEGDDAARVVQAQLLALARVGERQGLGADVTISPEAGAIGLTEVWRAAELIAIGRRAAQEKADKIAGLL